MNPAIASSALPIPVSQYPYRRVKGSLIAVWDRQRPDVPRDWPDPKISQAMRWVVGHVNDHELSCWGVCRTKALAMDAAAKVSKGELHPLTVWDPRFARRQEFSEVVILHDRAALEDRLREAFLRRVSMDDIADKALDLMESKDDSVRLRALEFVTKHIGLIPPKPIERGSGPTNGSSVREATERFLKSDYWRNYLARLEREQGRGGEKVIDGVEVQRDRTVHGLETNPIPSQEKSLDRSEDARV